MVSFPPGHRVGQAYPLLLAAACIAGLIWLGRQPATRMEAGLVILAGSLIGGRLGFVALHLPYFSAHPVEIAWFWQGGLSWVGAALGTCAAVGAAGYLTGTSPWILADALSVPAAVVALASWTGCLVDACAFGRPVVGLAWAPAAYDSFGYLARRWPTQAAGMVLSGALLSGLLRWDGMALPAGTLGAGTLAALAALTTMLSLTRGDPSMMIGLWRIDTLAGAGIFLGAVVTILVRRRSMRHLE